MINRSIFYESFRAAFGRLRQSQVDGMNILLALMDADPWPTIWHAAYFMATVKHEAAETWWPISERGPIDYFGQYEPGMRIGNELGNVMPGDGYLYRGRGYVQVTGRRNYERATKETGFPLLSYPEGLLWPALSYQVAKSGMLLGWFTGASLDNYSGDYRNARRVVNGTDRAELIAGYATKFETIMKRSA